MERYCCLRNVQDLLADGKTPHERRFGESFKGQIISFGAQVEYLPKSERDIARIHQFGKKVSPIIFIDYALIAGDIEEELEKLDASEKNPRRLNAKEVLISQKNGEFIFPVADGSAKINREELQIPRTHSEAAVDRKERESQRRISR